MIMVGPTQVVQAPPMQQIIAEAAAPIYIQSQQMQAPQVIETMAAPQMTYAAPQMTYAAPQQLVEMEMMAAPTTMMAAPTMMTTMVAPTTF